MDFKEAKKIISNFEKQNIKRDKADLGFMVHFCWIEGGVIRSDFFPNKWKSEILITNEDDAWNLAKRFADAMGNDKICNVYVIGKDYVPVAGYSSKTIFRR